MYIPVHRDPVDMSNQYCGLNAVVQGGTDFYWKTPECRADKALAKGAWC